MELDETNYELFRNYLTGDLSAEEEEAFKDRLESDEDFAELFEEEKAFSATVQEVLFQQQNDSLSPNKSSDSAEQPSSNGPREKLPDARSAYILLVGLVFALVSWWLITKVW
ncbi:MAG: hypothetical protein AAF990_07575 [Bacteroidota bacterium]